MIYPDGEWYKITISKEPDYLLNIMYSVYPYNIKNFNLYAWICNGIRDICGTKNRILIERYNADKTVDIIFKMEGE
tara:strand:- start:2945 stop:3172 length:228 start_codon:yes stop_codon:yes gene_type:complete